MANGCLPVGPSFSGTKRKESPASTRLPSKQPPAQQTSNFPQNPVHLWKTNPPTAAAIAAAAFL